MRKRHGGVLWSFRRESNPCGPKGNSVVRKKGSPCESMHVSFECQGQNFIALLVWHWPTESHMPI